MDVEISESEPATVRYAVLLGTIPADVTSAATGIKPIPWRVTYTGDPGAEIEPHTQLDVRGSLHIRERIFDTGLAHTEFADILRGLIGSDAVFGSQASWAPQIDAAEQILVAWIRANATVGADREDGIDGGAFKIAHAYWAASLIESDPERRAGFSDTAERYAGQALASLVVTDSDTDVATVEAHARRPSLLFGSSTPRTDDSETAPFYIGRPR